MAGLEGLAALGWRPSDEERLGDWLLRAASGFSGRANSALAIGDPGTSLATAIGGVMRWYQARGLPAMVAVPFAGGGPDRGEVDRYLAGRGWQIRAREAIVMTAAPGAVPHRSPPAGVRIDLAPEPDGPWLRCYHFHGQELPPAARGLLMSAPWQAFASARAGGRTVAVGRVAAGGGWAGLTAVEVDPAYRRQGLASAITTALAGAAASHGAAGLYLQVLTENSAARLLYQRAGFTDHHRYHYRVAPTTAAGSDSVSGAGS
jgi:N-acetylglutamate synthase